MFLKTKIINEFFLDPLHIYIYFFFSFRLNHTEFYNRFETVTLNQ